MMDYCIQNSILVHRVVDATVGGARGGAAAGWVEWGRAGDNKATNETSAKWKLNHSYTNAPQQSGGTSPVASHRGSAYFQ